MKATHIRLSNFNSQFKKMIIQRAQQKTEFNENDCILDGYVWGFNSKD